MRAAAPPSRVAESGCPVPEEARNAYRSSKAFNVYSQEINPKNNMPYNPNQLPQAGQRRPIDTTRVASTIPKAGTDGTWTYPSPQMFYNALVRKDKADDVDESDMDNVVAIHNNMNEQTWARVAAWEAMHRDECDDPRLLRFKGRPHELSPKARFLSFFGLRPAPFDRHDWIVDRGGREVRYVIDYYHLEKGGGNARSATFADGQVMDEQYLHVDVRPALDSAQAAWDRLVVFFGGLRPHDAEADVLPAPSKVGRERGEDPDAAAVMWMNKEIRDKCGRLFEAVAACEDAGRSETEDGAACAEASIALQVCMGSLICKPETDAFLAAVRDPDADEAVLDGALAAVGRKLDEYEAKAQRATADVVRGPAGPSSAEA
jgi:cytochrome c heme-lyase